MGDVQCDNLRVVEEVRNPSGKSDIYILTQLKHHRKVGLSTNSLRSEGTHTQQGRHKQRFRHPINDVSPDVTTYDETHAHIINKMWWGAVGLLWGTRRKLNLWRLIFAALTNELNFGNKHMSLCYTCNECLQGMRHRLTRNQKLSRQRNYDPFSDTSSRCKPSKENEKANASP